MLRWFKKSRPNFKIIKDLYKNRLQRYGLCGKDEDKEKIQETEAILGSAEKVAELANRFEAFENDDVWLEDALTFMFLRRNIPSKYKSNGEVVKLIEEAIGYRNNFLRQCQREAAVKGMTK